MSESKSQYHRRKVTEWMAEAVEATGRNRFLLAQGCADAAALHTRSAQIEEQREEQTQSKGES